jgi:hypothetical protein
MTYATLAQVRAYLKFTATETADDALLTTFLGWAQQTLDAIRRGDVLYATRYYDYPIAAPNVFGAYDAETWVQQMNATGALAQGRLALDDDLLALASVTNGDGNAIPLTALVTEPANLYPKHLLRIKSGSGYRWLPATHGDREQVIAVTGWWGYHPRYEDAWTAADTVQDDPLTAIATSLTVSDADNFQAGQMLRLGSELITVTAVDSDHAILSVTRGVNGTPAVAHANDIPIYLYSPWGNYTLAATRLAVWRYRQKDANVFDQTTSFETGTTIIPSTLPADIRSLLPPRRMVSL